MKDLKEMTDEELLSLTGEEVDHLVRVKLAEDGVPIEFEPTEPKYEEVPEPTEEVYSCDLVSANYVVRDKGIWEDLLDSVLPNLLYSDYDYNTDDQAKRYIEVPTEVNYRYSSVNPPPIKKSMAYTKESYVKVKATLRSNSVLRKEYNKKRDAYKRYLAAYEDAKDLITEPIQEAVSRQQEYQRYNRLYQEYLVLAEGDVQVACRFFLKAYKDVPKETMEKVVGPDEGYSEWINSLYEGKA